jgi:hypothetical protein
MSAAPFPSEIVGIADGIIYGLWLGKLYGAIAWWCGAMLEYTLVLKGPDNSTRKPSKPGCRNGSGDSLLVIPAFSLLDDNYRSVFTR